MLTDLESGDVAETIAKFFEASKHVQPAPKAKAVRIVLRSYNCILSLVQFFFENMRFPKT